MNQSSPSRLVLGATCYADASSALPLAVVIAAATGAELAGVLIEEEALAEVAPSVFDRAGRGSRTADAEEMRRAFERDAAAFERQLRDAATLRALRWRFALRRGRAFATLSAEAGADGLVLLSGEAANRRVSEVVLLSGNGTPGALSALAVEMTRRERCGLRVIAHGTKAVRGTLSEPAQYEAMKNRSEVQARLSRLPAATLLIADLADAGAELGSFLEHARFARLVRAGKSATGVQSADAS